MREPMGKIWFIVCHDCPSDEVFDECTFDPDNFDDFRKNHVGHRIEEVLNGTKKLVPVLKGRIRHESSD
jgi:hypothetical protein